MGETLISVIVPVHNLQAYLGSCIESICSQTHQDIELILVDSGSVDGSSEICDSYAQNDARIHVVHLDNCGASGARNEGLRQAKGDYISFVDADDLVHPRMYELMLQAMHQSDADVVICRERSFDSILEWEPIDDAELTIASVDTADSVCSHFADDWNSLSNWVTNKLFKRSAIGDIRFVEDRLFEDICFTSEVLSGVEKSVFIKNRLYGYRVREDSIIKAKTDNVYLNFTEAILHQNEMLKNHCSDEVSTRYAKYMVRKLARTKAQAFQDGKTNVYDQLSVIYKNTLKLVDRRTLSAKEKMIVFLSTKTKIYDRHQKVNEF